MNASTKTISLFIYAIFLLTGCSDNSLTIKSDYKLIAYDELKTYRWYDKSQPEIDSTVTEAVRQSIKKAIDKALTEKGLSLQTSGDVDFFVNINVSAKDHVDLKDSITYSGIAPGYSWNRESGFQQTKYIQPQTEYIHHRDGSLIIDIVDFSSDKLIWRGIAEKRLTKELSENQREALIKKAVSAILADFPPKADKK